MALVIQTVLNDPYEDGLNLKVQLGSAPTGTLKFYAYPSPGQLAPPDPSLEKTYTGDGVNAYKVQVRAGATTEPALLHRLPFYVVAHDNGGYSNLGGDWLAAGANSDWLNQTDDALQDIFAANIGLLDRAMAIQLGSPNMPSGRPCQVQKVHTGPVQIGETFPCIAHTAYSCDEDYLGGGNTEGGRPYSDLVAIHSRIECYALVQGDAYWGSILKALGMGVFNLLNQPLYTHFIRLDSNLKLFQNKCDNGVLSEYYDASLEEWVQSFTLSWTGNLHAGKYSPDQYPQ